jgi:hypothetical protein
MLVDFIGLRYYVFVVMAVVMVVPSGVGGKRTTAKPSATTSTTTKNPIYNYTPRWIGVNRTEEERKAEVLAAGGDPCYFMKKTRSSSGLKVVRISVRVSVKDRAFLVPACQLEEEDDCFPAEFGPKSEEASNAITTLLWLEQKVMSAKGVWDNEQGKIVMGEAAAEKARANVSKHQREDERKHMLTARGKGGVRTEEEVNGLYAAFQDKIRNLNCFSRNCDKGMSRCGRGSQGLEEVDVTALLKELKVIHNKTQWTLGIAHAQGDRVDINICSTIGQFHYGHIYIGISFTVGTSFNSSKDIRL